MGKADFDFYIVLLMTLLKIGGVYACIQYEQLAFEKFNLAGHFTYHKANTEEFGGVYIGYGFKNSDIPFIQQ